LVVLFSKYLVSRTDCSLVKTRGEGSGALKDRLSTMVLNSTGKVKKERSSGKLRLER
jgi:hypothetical protein